MLSQVELLDSLPYALTDVEIPRLGPRLQGKVRDIFQYNGNRVLVATDRVSAFDRVLGTIPYRGQVLNQLSAWWFDATRDIVSNHLVEMPDPNVSVVREAQAIPVEVVVRGYITGVTSTSMWTLYAGGDRQPYGVPLPDGLKKNDPLPQPVITPTTKASDGGHDERLTRDELVQRGLVDEARWQQIETVANNLFLRGQALARENGMVLVDTKYEFGLINGTLTLIDEIHTPDSSRYWSSESLTEDMEPEHYDKEYLRLWFAAKGYRGAGEPPPIPDDIRAAVAARYITTYERLTGQRFVPGSLPMAQRIRANMDAWLDRHVNMDGRGKDQE